MPGAGEGRVSVLTLGLLTDCSGNLGSVRRCHRYPRSGAQHRSTTSTDSSSSSRGRGRGVVYPPHPPMPARTHQRLIASVESASGSIVDSR